MRLLAGVLALCAALVLSGVGWAQPPEEGRTNVDEARANNHPGAPAAATENTVKEPWVCPYCGYSTGGTMDTLDLNTDNNPDGDANGNGVPDEAEGTCPDPWSAPGHPGNVALEPLNRTQRFFAFRWLGPLLEFVRGVPYRVGDQNESATYDERSTVGSRVRAAFAFSAAGTPGFASGATQGRFLLIPPGVGGGGGGAPPPPPPRGGAPAGGFAPPPRGWGARGPALPQPRMGAGRQPNGTGGDPGQWRVLG